MKMNWDDLLNTKRKNGKEFKEMSRVENEYTLDAFSFDYRRITQSASFRRLQDKTQVYPLEKIDFIRTRLTHSIEVSAIAEELGKIIFDNLNSYYLKDENVDVNSIQVILKSAGLIHDLGNPPFGHFGESVIQEWFKNNFKNYDLLGKPVYKTEGEKEKNEGLPVILTMQHANDFINFDGNAHTFRILNRLHFDRGQSGMNLTYPILSSIGKYTASSDNVKATERITDKKIGHFRSEKEDVFAIAKELGTLREDGSICRHPLAFIVEAADDIAYRLADLEDTFKKGLVSLDGIKSYIRERFNDYKSKHPEVNMTKVDYLIKSLENPEDCTMSEYNVLNKWLFEVQIHLMNAAKFSFTKNYYSIMSGSYDHDLFYGTFHEYTMKILGDVSIKYAFSNQEVNILELSSEEIIGYFLDKLVPALVIYDVVDKLPPVDKKFISLISDNYLDNYKLVREELKQKYQVESDEFVSEALYHRLLIAVDFVAGMTDSYAKELYNRLNGFAN